MHARSVYVCVPYATCESNAINAIKGEISMQSCHTINLNHAGAVLPSGLDSYLSSTEAQHSLGN